MTISPDSSTTIPLGEYLVSRLAQLGLKHAFGVPGDFNLTLLDHFENSKDLKWVGFCNELNAAYAADGFSRVKGTPMALVTTYGVGELSALNGVSGAFAENVPIIHIVGTTGRPIQEKGLLIHHVSPPKGHDLLPADHRVYPITSKPFCCVQEYLLDPLDAPRQIDLAISEAYKQALPTYIYFPTDMVPQPVPKSLLTTPLPLEIVNKDNTLEEIIVNDILTALYTAKSPTILADTIAERLRARDLVTALVEKAKIWSFSTPLSKGLVDETSPYFVGVYNGELSHKGVADAVHSSDLVLNIGPLLSDSNTGGFTRKIKDENLILLHPLYCKIKGTLYKGVHFYPILQKLYNRLDASKIISPRPPKPTITNYHDRKSPADISLASLLHSIGPYLKENDTIIPEVGTVQFASPDIQFTKNNSIITQIFYSSIGFSLPAAVGAAFAKRELNPESPGRIVLLEGDGSAQMTIQELGTMVRHQLDITVFLLNNSGYSIERAIWGPQQGYNDICPDWKWTMLLSAFGGTPGKNCLSTKISTKKDLESFFDKENSSFTLAKVPRLVEVILHPNDYPWRLDEQIRLMGKSNIDMYKEYSLKHDSR